MVGLAKASATDPDITQLGKVCLLVAASLAKKMVRRISIGVTETFESSVGARQITSQRGRPFV